MRGITMWTISVVCATSVAVALSLLLVSPCGAAETRRPILIVSWNPPLDPELVRILDKNGFAVNAGGLGMTAEELRRYQAVIICAWPHANPDFTIPEGYQKTVAALVEYVRGGGGLWINQWHGQNMGDWPMLNYLSAQFGLKWPMHELNDPVTGTTGGFRPVTYAFTREVAPSPVSAGVKQLWYPIGGSYMWGLNTVALEPSPDWTVVVRTGPDAEAKAVDLKPFNLEHLALGENRKGKLPIFAIREFGKGRVAACPIWPPYHMLSGYVRPLGRITVTDGLKGEASDFEALLLNTLLWLTDGGRAAGLGSDITTPKEWFQPRFFLPEAQPLNWEGRKFHPRPAQWRGVFGARTTYSVGKATATEWVEAAKKRGLDFIVFTEDYQKITDADFGRLKQDCLALSDEKFAAIPGIAFQDAHGDHWFACGDRMDLPNESERVPGQRRLGPPKPGVQMGMLLLNWVYARLGMTIGVGSWLHTQSAIPYYDCRWYHMMAVVTQDHGALVEEMWEPFLHLTNRGEVFTPVAINVMDHPDGLNGLLTGDLYHTVLTSDVGGGSGPYGTDVRVTRGFLGNHQQWATEGLRYITNGPRILDWQYMGVRDYAGQGNDFLTSLYRWPCRVEVESDVGLAEVKIMDGQELIRRWLPGGAKQFSAVVPLVHNQQHNMVVLATDVRGHKAISSEIWDHNHALEEFICGDRNNQLLYGHKRRPDGSKFQNGRCMGITPTKGPWSGNGALNPAGFWAGDPVLGGDVPGFDASVGGDPVLNMSLSHTFQGGSFDASRLHLKGDRLTTSTDFCSGLGYIDGNYKPDAVVGTVWDTMEPIVENPYIEGGIALLYFNTRVDSFSALLGEMWFKPKQDLIQEAKGRSPRFGYFNPVSATHVMIVKDGKVITDRRVGEPGETLEGDLKVGDYLVYYGSNLGGVAVFPLDDNLSFRAQPEGKTTEVFFRTGGETIPRGRELRSSVLTVGAPPPDGGTGDFAATFADKFGMDGAIGYPLEVKSGKLLGSRYVLRLDGAGQGARVAIRKTDLPAYLPLQVEKLNPRWSVGLYEIGRQRYRPVGMLGKVDELGGPNSSFQPAAIAQIDPAAGDIDVFVGHPFVCDNNDVFLAYMEKEESGAQGADLEIHNPTDRTLRVAVRPSKDFAARVKAEPFTLNLKPGSSVIRSVAIRQNR